MWIFVCMYMYACVCSETQTQRQKNCGSCEAIFECHGRVSEHVRLTTTSTPNNSC